MDEQPRHRPPLCGAYLVLDNAPPIERFRNALVGMRRLGMDVAIVQHLCLYDAEGDEEAVRRDVVETVLVEADRLKMRVFLGLALPTFAAGNMTLAKDPRFAAELAERSVLWAQKAAHLYGAHASLQGWHVPLPLWTPTAPGELGALPECVRQVAGACKRLSQRADVLVSAYVSCLAADARLTETAFAELLAASAVDIVALHDAAGSHRLDVASDATARRLRVFFDALCVACRRTHKQMWACVESFWTEADGRRRPTDFATLRSQISIAESASMGVVTSEFVQYWAIDEGLYKAYDRAFVR